MLTFLLLTGKTICIFLNLAVGMGALGAAANAKDKKTKQLACVLSLLTLANAAAYLL